MSNPDLAPGALLKRPKGSSWLDARERRKAIRDFEDAEKAKVRKRDKACRWPKCEHCAKARREHYVLPLECAHLRAKGAGGDHGHRSTASQMMLLCRPTHQYGTDSLEQHGRRIEPLTAEGTDGPCVFYRTDEEGREYVVAVELGIGGPYERD